MVNGVGCKLCETAQREQSVFVRETACLCVFMQFVCLISFFFML